jgi:CBS domain-containing protein
MLTKELISDEVPSLKTSDTGIKALYWMDIFRISHLPIVNNEEFLGLISDTDIYDMNTPDEAIGNHNLSLFSPFVYDYQHVYDAIEVVSRLKLTVVPVLDTDKNYLGLITVQRFIQYMGDLFGIKNPGGIIVLELKTNDYSLSQIAQIIESNDAKILSLYIQTLPDSKVMDLTLKINRIDLGGIIQTFIRFDYLIKASYSEHNDLELLYSDRYEQFMHFLKV